MACGILKNTTSVTFDPMLVTLLASVQHVDQSTEESREYPDITERAVQFVTTMPVTQKKIKGRSKNRQ